MKKWIVLLLSLLLALSICACSGADAPSADETDLEEVQKTEEELLAEQRAANAAAVEKQINGLGIVSLESAEALQKAEAAYAALTEEEQALVPNGEVLTAARMEYDGLVEEREIRSNSVVVAKIDREGTAYIPLNDGTTIELRGQIVRATLTQNRKYIIALEKDGLLYYVKVDAPTEKHVISNEVSEVTATRAEGLLYLDANKELHRFLFEVDEDYVIGTAIAYKVADHSLTVLSADGDGYIYVTEATKELTDKIGSFEKDEILLKGISDDGTTALWVEKQKSTSWRNKNNTYWTYLYAEGERNYLGETSNTSESTRLRFNADQSVACVINIYENTVFLKYPGEDYITVKLVKPTSVSTIYTENCNLEDDPGTVEKGIYVLVDNDTGSDLYYIDRTGDREKVISKVEEFLTAKGRIYYRTEDNELYTATLDGYNLLDEEKLSNEVHMFKISEDGNTVFYVKNIDKDSLGSLFYWQVGDEKSQKISSECYNYTATIYGYTFYLPYFYLGADGETVYYYESRQEAANGYLDIGVLKKMTIGGEPERVATDVIINTLSSGRADGVIDPNYARFEKYLYIDEEYLSQVDWIWFDGEETNPIAREVYYDAKEQTDIAENMEK